MLSIFLSLKAREGGNTHGRFDVPFDPKGEGYNVAFLMGSFSYHWSLGERRPNGTYLATITVDDPYDFHMRMDASLPDRRVVPLYGRNIIVESETTIPDKVILDMKTYLGAQDFNRKITWTEVIWP